jgi:FLVCR family feline leukemia virus subgroup C receptor-related protein
MMIQNITATIAGGLLIIFAREKPPTPPSASAERPPVELNLKNELKTLMKNRSYLLLVLGYATLYGTVTAVGAIISSLTLPYGYTVQNNSLFGGAFIISGIFGSILTGIILDKTHKFKLSFMIISFVSIAMMSLVLITLPSKIPALFTANLVLLGFGAISLVPLSLSFCVELTYPTPEAVSNGMMLLPSKVYGAILAVVAGLAS